VLTFTLVFLLLHGALATVLAALQALRVHRGHVSLAAPYEPAVVAICGASAPWPPPLAWVLMALLPMAFGTRS
jgi:cytochrome c oxidase subunit I+III